MNYYYLWAVVKQNWRENIRALLIKSYNELNVKSQIIDLYYDYMQKFNEFFNREIILHSHNRYNRGGP